jgi:DnaK suppressor protein
MDTPRFKQRLLEIEKQLTDRIDRESTQGRDQFIDTAADAGDASVADEGASQSFSAADADTTVLQQVREALARIEDGSYGTCVVDGRPIEEKRLEAVPWTPYCLEHAERLEDPSTRPPTL